MHLIKFNRKKLGLAFLIFVLLLMIAGFSLRGVLLRKAIRDVAQRFRNHNYKVHIDGAGFKGLSAVYIKEIFIQSETDDNSVQINSLFVKPRIIPLLAKRIRIKRINAESILVRYNYMDSTIVANATVRNDSAGFLEARGEIDMAGFAFRNIRRLFHYIPSRVNLGKVDVKVKYSDNLSGIGIDDFKLNHGKFSATFVLTGDSNALQLPFSGKLDKSTPEISFGMVNPDTSFLPVPILRDKYGFEAGFDSVEFSVDLSRRNRHMVSPQGVFAFSGFKSKGVRLSTGNILIDHFTSSFKVNIGASYAELDSATEVYLNRIVFHPYLKISLLSKPVIDFKIIPQTWAANDFFSSLPQGMFTSLKGIQTEGTLHYFLTFSVDMACPDSLFFNTRLTGDHFRIKSYGVDDYRMLNGSFTQRVYEKGRLVAAFPVGTENPDFVSFEEISPFLRAAVMTSEDGSFFYHNGFNPKAFTESISTNIKEKRFARGGSTISMQLVKNVFLTRNKTLARKIEEAIIVWIIENENLVAKQRMYEVYLNIIEWGPGIYGINQASHFYFNKKPSDLNLQESVYLASIVPHPKWYKYSFESNGVMRPFFAPYYSRLKELMVRREFINPSDTFGIQPVVTLTGPAAVVFDNSDTSRADSLRSMDMLELIPSLQSF
ncbi:MAG: transglycosylase domain-containing protein [Bacteroidales bacterium]|nr:transglycosylase domain-containing protein [Bacteroidales bacterium]